MTTLSRICVKRLMGDVKFLKQDPLEFIDAFPDETNMLTWYFLLKGPAYSDYAGGYYLGHIMHSPEYPFKPPDFKMLTPSGRFTINTKICLSNSSYHSNEWSAMWTIKSILIGFLSIMLDDNEHGISHINQSKPEKKYYAKASVDYNKEHYMAILKKFTRFFDADGNPLPEDDQAKKLSAATGGKTEKVNDQIKSDQPNKNDVSDKKGNDVKKAINAVQGVKIQDTVEVIPEPTPEVKPETTPELPKEVKPDTTPEPPKEVTPDIHEVVTDLPKEIKTNTVQEPEIEAIIESLKIDVAEKQTTETQPVKVTKKIITGKKKKTHPEIKMFDPSTLQLFNFNETDEKYKKLMSEHTKLN